jgi:hypothetical protein
MTKKKRIVILSVAVLLFVLGFLTLAIAASIQDTVNNKYANILGLSSFGFWGLSLFILIKNFTNMVFSEMNETTEKMHNEVDFFSMISINENPQTLEERFIKSGFKLQQGYLHKRQFSFAKDYINYYVAIANEESIMEYFNVFLSSVEDLFQNKSRFHKNNVIYVFFFNRNITNEELVFIKSIIINQDVAQGLPINFDTILPIVYDITNQKYIIKALKNRFSIKLLHIALRKFYKMISNY